LSSNGMKTICESASAQKPHTEEDDV